MERKGECEISGRIGWNTELDARKKNKSIKEPLRRDKTKLMPAVNRGEKSFAARRVPVHL